MEIKDIGSLEPGEKAELDQYASEINELFTTLTTMLMSIRAHRQVCEDSACAGVQAGMLSIGMTLSAANPAVVLSTVVKATDLIGQLYLDLKEGGVAGYATRVESIMRDESQVDTEIERLDQAFRTWLFEYGESERRREKPKQAPDGS